MSMSAHAQESRDFRSYHAFLRAARNYMEGPLVGQMHDSYEHACEQRGLTGERAPKDWRTAEAVLDHLPEFQLYNWACCANSRNKAAFDTSVLLPPSRNNTKV
jgi:hypothetical protein